LAWVFDIIGLRVTDGLLFIAGCRDRADLMQKSSLRRLKSRNIAAALSDISLPDRVRY